MSGAGHPSAQDPGAEVSRETLMRYLDGELEPGERREVEAALERSTELQRELALFRSFHDDLSTLRVQGIDDRRSVWSRVHRRLSRPIGWLLLAIGSLVWIGHTAWLYASSPAPTWEKAATSAIVIGVLLLFASVIHDRYREWQTDPYRDVER